MSSSESTSAFFVEYNEVIELIQILHVTDNSNKDAKTSSSFAEEATTANNIQNGNQALSKFKRIFDKYLECPSLLDSKLESILSLLSKECIEIIHELYEYLLCERSQEEEEIMNLVVEQPEETNDNETAGNKNSRSGIDTPGNEIGQECCDENTSVSNNNQHRSKSNHALKIKIIKRYMSAIYTICKVRGYKHVAKYLSHETKDVEPVLCILRHMEDISDGKYELNFLEQQQENSSLVREVEIAEHWESIYVLLLWLGMLSLVPFDLNTIDSAIITSSSDITSRDCNSMNNNIGNENQQHQHNSSSKSITLISSMITTIQKHLSDAGPTRAIASSSLAKLFSRPDLEEDELKSFVLFSNQVILSFLSKSSKNDTTSIPTTTTKAVTNFLVMGVIQTLANVFKTGNRSTLMESHLTLVEILWENTILLSEHLSASSSSNGGISSTSMVLRKFLVKLFARVGCSYLPPRIATWRYQRGKRSLLENLSKAAVVINDTNSFKTDCQIDQSDKEESTKTNEKDYENEEKKEDNEDLFDVPDQVEDSMAQLMQYLTDSATTVRWSAAKGIGRLTERLPALCADDVLDTLLVLCTKENNIENDCVWHGSCLTLAELARRGLLLPSRLNEVIPIVIAAIQYDVPKGSHSVGSHVRDAACYVCWAFARSYAPSVLRPYVEELSKGIVVASLFDREINCRRAASASFQECVGRQGADNFKHGIAILTTADYFTLGNRVESFTTIAKKIASFEEYRHPIIDHLYEEKLFHWDGEIRKLSSISLRMLTSLEPEYFTKTLLPNLLALCTDENLTTRHGAIIGIAEIVLALGEWSQGNEDNKSKEIDFTEKPTDVNLLSEELQLELASVVTQIEKARLYRGRGGEIMRAAVSRFIECVSKSRIPLTIKQQVGLLDSLDANLKHPNEDIQRAAANALSALMTYYFPVGSSGPSERLQNRVVNNYVKLVREEENPAATRGYALALGHLPAKLVAFNKKVLDEVIDCLCQAANRQSTVGQQGDAETRRNAIESIVRLCENVGIGENTAQSISNDYPVVGIDVKQTKQIFDCLLDCTKDYNTDRRGDVGSWSRIAAMKGLATLTLLSIKASDIPQNPPSQNPQTVSYELMIVPSFKDRVASSFEPNASIAVQESIAKGTTYRNNHQHISELHVYFDDEICARILGSILKQLAEKLDVVRTQAGICLEHLLVGSNLIPFTPRKQMLLEGLDMVYTQHGGEQAMNWGNPDMTFPLLMRVINIDAFFHEILSGLVISVGGLTESVTNSSSKAFLDYCRILKQSKLIGKLSKIGKSFIKLFDDHPKDNRVILPLLVTIDKVLSNGVLDCLFEDKRSDFPKELVKRIRRESSRCADIKRILAIVPVALGTLHTHDKDYAHGTIFPFVMRLLGHRFPRIRRYTAEQLYIKLLEDDSIVPKVDQIEKVQTILAEVAWDRELGVPGNVRQSRNQVADMLGIHLTEKDRVGPTLKESVKKPIDEYASYQSLVESAGR